MRKAKKLKKAWYTYAYFTAEGTPHPAHRLQNFTRVYSTVEAALDPLIAVMSDERFHRGAYAVALWPGELGEHEAVHGKTKPLYYVYQGPRVEKVS